MKRMSFIFIFGLIFSIFSGLVLADAGHDEVAPTQSAETAPRIVTHSDLFELVGVVESGTMTIYLDRYADNAPVTDANIEVEAGSEQGIAKTNTNGTYSFAAKAFTASSEIPVTFTISVGDETDLLAADLVMADTHKEDAHVTTNPFVNKWLIGLFIVIAALIVGVLIRHRRRQPLNTFTGALK